jgi:hypothetical protein
MKFIIDFAMTGAACSLLVMLIWFTERAFGQRKEEAIAKLEAVAEPTREELIEQAWVKAAKAHKVHA